MKKTFKKFVAVILAVVLSFSAFAVIGNAASLRRLDFVFVVDTTGSMEDDIYQVKLNMKEHLDQLSETGSDWRVAIVDYRDFSSRAGSRDYPYCVQLDFTNDYTAIINAIDALTLGHGGDWEETICSALIDGLDELSWRDIAGKAALIMGDAPALDPEPYTGYTVDMAIEKLNTGSIGYDVEEYSEKRAVARAASTRSEIKLFTIATSMEEETVECFEYLAEGTGGKSYVSADSEDITEIITEIIEEIPDVVEDNEESFWDLLWEFFEMIWYFISFQWLF